MTPGSVHSSWPGPLYDVPINTLARIVGFFHEEDQHPELIRSRIPRNEACKKSLREIYEEQFKAIFMVQLHRVVRKEIKKKAYFRHLDPRLKRAKGTLSISDFECLIKLLLTELNLQINNQNQKYVFGLALRIRGFLPSDSPVKIEVPLRAAGQQKQKAGSVNWKYYLQKFQFLLLNALGAPSVGDPTKQDAIPEWLALKNEAVGTLPPKQLKFVFFLLKKDFARLGVQPELAKILPIGSNCDQQSVDS